MIDNYKTIHMGTTFEKKEKGSRFIGRAEPVQSREAAESFFAKIARQHFDATHNCFAYRLYLGQQEITRFSDDGEPSGTAGKPILQAIRSFELTNIIVIVTRYFGGTKLGTGGLIRAYGEVASKTLSRAEHRIVYLQDTLELSCTYQQLNTIKKLIDKFSGKIIESDYGETIHFVLQCRKSWSEQFIQNVIDLTSGHVKPNMVN